MALNLASTGMCGKESWVRFKIVRAKRSYIENEKLYFASRYHVIFKTHMFDLRLGYSHEISRARMRVCLVRGPHLLCVHSGISSGCSLRYHP